MNFFHSEICADIIMFLTKFARQVKWPFLDDSTLLICSPWTFLLLFSLFRDKTVVISAKRFLFRPEVHYNQVYAVDDKKLKKMKLSVPVFDFSAKQKSKNPTPGSSEKVKSSSSSTTALEPNIKVGSSNPKRAAASIQDLLDPVISTSAAPKSDMRRWALGTMYKMIHQGANKCVSNLTVLYYYDSGIGMVKDYHNVLKPSSELRASSDFNKIRPTPKVALNNHNIVNVQKYCLRYGNLGNTKLNLSKGK